jgi:hypothetical protein
VRHVLPDERRFVEVADGNREFAPICVHGHMTWQIATHDPTTIALLDCLFLDSVRAQAFSRNVNFFGYGC